ncbi:hypothetical protein [Enterococcus dispar]|uniref:hypothetical protein n=1 Tax=Enterococcus dispar TaxID=44009 RepID=UPI00248F84F4|nr:hypothetical protein [Enterococcus dispar]
MKKSNRKKAKRIRQEIAAVMGLNPKWMENADKVKEIQKLGHKLSCLEDNKKITLKKPRKNSFGVHVRLKYPDGKIVEVKTIVKAAEIAGCSKETVHKALKIGKQPKRGNAKGIVFEEIISNS